ncbi:hypothetical protein C6P45_003021 [Maudiozyma exigua]|uniref:Uncharacterized protein n=1 Tax=Maudiozyma exigua TaxID=34358 RepID=A0A9P6WHE0_MAUEX|nr:hypothetical protein C6P45_003021 [Kazachstania exigua]
MDYSLKKDNRKKFQDKQKLKHKHSTPSDKKYYHLKKTEESIEDAKSKKEKLEKKLGNNFERYDQDSNNINSDEQGNNIFEQLDAYDSTQDRIKLQSILKERVQEEKETELRQHDTKMDPNNFTSRDIHSMDINELNNLIGRTKIADESVNESPILDKIVPKTPANTNKIEKAKSMSKQVQDKSLIPPDLHDDQAFLDDIL